MTSHDDHFSDPCYSGPRNSGFPVPLGIPPVCPLGYHLGAYHHVNNMIWMILDDHRVNRLSSCTHRQACLQPWVGLQRSQNYMGQNNMGQKSGRRGKSSFFHQIIFRKMTLSRKMMNIVVSFLKKIRRLQQVRRSQQGCYMS